MSVPWPIYERRNQEQILSRHQRDIFCAKLEVDREYNLAFSTGRTRRELSVASLAEDFVMRGVSYQTAVEWAEAEIPGADE